MERKEQEVAEEYLSSLADLNLNSKPLINMLTILAEENIEYAPIIVKAVEQHISKVNPDVKLPVLYLIDSIVKNVGRDYITLFSHRIVNIFCGVFEKVNEKIREKMYTLRQTWNDVFTTQKLYALDVKVNCMDPNWPITAKVTTKVPVSKSPAIHVNPNFLKNQAEPLNDMEAKLRDKQRQLLELQKRKLELELAATKQRLEEQEKQLTMQTETVKPIQLPSGIPPMTASNMPPRPQQMFNTYRPPHLRTGTISTPNFIGCQSNATKTRIAPVNPSMINVLRHRDPRLARQQQQQQQNSPQQQQSMQQSQLNPLISTINSSEFDNISANSDSQNVLLIAQNSNAAQKESLKRESLSPHRDIKKYEDKTDKTNANRSNSRSSSYHGDKDKSRNNSLTSNSKKTRDNFEKSNDKSPSSRSKSTNRINSLNTNNGKSSLSSSFGNRSGDKEGRSKERSSGSGSRDDDKRKTSSNSKNSSPNRSSGVEKSSPSSSSSKRERSPKKLATESPKHSTTTATAASLASASPIKFKEIKHNVKSRNYVKRERDREKCSNPLDSEKSRDVDLRASLISEKRMKLDEQSSRRGMVALSSTASNNSNNSNNLTDAITTSSTKSKDLEKNIEAVKSNKDVDLRQFQTTANKSATSSATANRHQQMLMMNKIEGMEGIKSSSTVEGNGGDIISPSLDDKKYDLMDIDTKKRQFTTTTVTGNKHDEPTAKKIKPDNEKIDILFGTEDVDLRNLNIVPAHHHLSAIVSSAGAMPMTPPPPIISNESENWAKVKGSKINKVSPTSSNFDDVRAKLAKAARTHIQQKLDKNKENRKSRFSDLNEDSSDGTDANIRTIISQAQELLASENINIEQYNTLVKTVIQINETNKLKEAQRRESLQNNNTKSSNTKTSSKSLPTQSEATSNQAQSTSSSGSDVKREDEDANTSLLKAKSKALQKRIPKLPKDATTTDINIEQNSVLQRLSPPVSNSINYTDTRNNSMNVMKSEKRGGGSSRQKESKWSPWDQGGSNHSNQNKPWISGMGGSGMNSRLAFNQKLPSNPASMNLLQSQNRMSMPNPWHNPPPMIFAGGNIPSAQAAAIQMPPPANTAAVDKTIQPTKQFCNSVDNPKDDVVRTINIDSVAKEIRIYNEVAIVFMDWDQPREIGFQGGQRRIIIDDQEPITLNFNDIYTTVMIANKPHKIRFGCPSRELYIDDNWYECCFGGPPIAIPIDGKVSIFKIEGPPPQVNIGNLRQDLVAGKINLIIDARILIPVFLDAKVQTFELDGKKHSLQFADCLKTVLIDGEAINVEYGGLPRSLYLGGIKYFVRFGTLPNGIVPGNCYIRDMICTDKFSLPSSPSSLPLSSLDAVMSVSSSTFGTSLETTTTSIPDVTGSNSLMIPMSTIADLSVGRSDDKVPSLISTTTTENSLHETKDKNETLSTISQPPTTTGTITGEAKPPQPILPPIANLNIDELFQKLLASGILNQNANNLNTNQDLNAKKQKDQDIIRPVDLSKSDTIKTRQTGIVQKLYSGMQCSSCGLRFPPEQTMKYSQHLDWHFRQNRRERDSSRKAHSRKWYYDVSDWVQYEEIEDIDEREKNWFEAQQNELENPEDISNQRTNSPTPTCPAGPDDVDRACDMCHDKFEQFYNEESEEWHLKSAIRVDDKIYHPLCYQDYKASFTMDETILPAIEGAEDDNAVDTVVIKEEKNDEKSEVILEDDDDDDDVIVLPTEEPSITEIPSDDEDDTANISVLPIDNVLSKNNDSESTGNNDKTTVGVVEIEKSTKDHHNDSVESDVEIQEPHIPFTDLDTYEEPPASLSTADDSSQQSSSLFNTIKIKEEPKDSDNEDDDFEDVGTFISIDEISQSVDEYVPQSITSTPGSDNLVASIDGNVDIQDTQTTTNIGVNKIKINITKNTTNSNSASLTSSPASSTTTSVTTISTGSTFQQKAQNIPVIGSGSAIPVICNFNKELPSTANTSNNFIMNINERDEKKTSSFSEEHKDKNEGNKVGINISSSDDDKNGNRDDGSSIEYELKSQLRGIEFKKMPKIDSGFETSGLCSIM